MQLRVRGPDTSIMVRQFAAVPMRPYKRTEAPESVIVIPASALHGREMAKHSRGVEILLSVT